MSVHVARVHVIVPLGIAVCVLFGTIIYKMYFDKTVTTNRSAKSLEFNLPTDKEEVRLIIDKLIQQRNNLSKVFNKKLQAIWELECQTKTDSNKLSSTDRWCSQTSIEEIGHTTDKKLLPVILELFKAKSVASFGNRLESYKQVLFGTGLLNSYDAYKVTPRSEEASKESMKFVDLTLPQYGLPLYDWILCLEVAEHIPQEYEAVFIDNIARHAREGIVLSWAIPGQQGYLHINNQPFTYVKDLLDKLGFEHDQESSEKLKMASEFDWLKKSINVYRRKDLSSIEHMKTVWT